MLSTGEIIAINEVHRETQDNRNLDVHIHTYLQPNRNVIPSSIPEENENEGRN